MNAKNKFILKQVLWSSSLLLFVLALYGIMGYAADGSFSLLNFPWFVTAFVVFDLIGIFYNLSRLKKMGIDMNLSENHNGTLTKNITVDLPKEKILDLLKQNVWKFKTESKTETTGGALLTMKYYRLIWNEKLEILVVENNPNESLVKITAGYKKLPLLLSAHNVWSNAIRHINYFDRELSKRQDLHSAIASAF